jgi:hypothetical protein
VERIHKPGTGDTGSAPAWRPSPATHPLPGPDNLSVQARRHRDEAHELDADRQADRLLHGTSPGTPLHAPAPSLLPGDNGRQPSAPIRRLAERGLGAHASEVRIHDDHEAHAIAASIGARAFADGAHIWLGPGESERDRLLMAHELAHVAQGEPGLHLRSATWLERRAWRSFFDHYLPRRFLDNYMDDTGTPITLNVREMMDINPVVNIRRSEGFQRELTALQAQVAVSAAMGAPTPGAKKYIEVSGPGQAMTNGTLGNFTIHYKGMLVVDTGGNWWFFGSMDFSDVWDFNPKPFGSSGRSIAGEVKTRVAATLLPGRAFEIFSIATPLMQTGNDRRATWAGGAPQFVNDRAGRAASDVEVGGGGGEAGSAVGGGEVSGEFGTPEGAEAGAQSAEDLN